MITAILVIATFLLAQESWPLIGWEREPEGWGYIVVRTLNRAFWYLLLPCLVLAWMYRPRNPGRELGLSTGFAQGMGMALVCTLPMLLGYAWLSGLQFSFEKEGFWLGCVLAALSEEVLYRGFFFGQLHRRVGLPFLVAAGAGAVFFGLGHLYQGNTVADTTGIFLVTLAGGLWFSWLYKAWDYNLWVPIGLHFLMNFYWMIFQAGDNALGGAGANVFRVLTIAVSVVWTLRRQRQARMQAAGAVAAQ